MKIKLVSFEDGVVSIGFRRISSLVKSEYPSTSTYLYNVGGISAMVKNIFSRRKPEKSNAMNEIHINPEFIKEIIDADVIGFSGMSKFADHVKRAISLVRQRNAQALIVWGGLHATVFPEDAIQHADAVCVGEGEKSFLALLKKRAMKESISDCLGFWTRENGVIKQNPLMPLLTNADLSGMPFQDYSFNIHHVTDRAIEPMSKDIYVSQMGSRYSTIWALGCPYRCSYCSNSKFLKNHGDYAKIRRSTVDHFINELVEVKKNHDYVQFVEVMDDNFLALSLEEIKEFARLYKEKIGLTLFIPGIHPLTVDEDKLRVLVDAGLRKVRMGVQSGCKKTLSFYGRDPHVPRILNAAKILSSFTPEIVPPFYDMIIDNPIETAEDKLETLLLLRELSRPFLLYVYSLRLIPGTKLYDYAQAHPEVHFQPIEESYQTIHDKEMGLMVYLLALCRPPLFLFNLMLKIAKIPFVKDVLFIIFQVLFLSKMFFYETKIQNYQPIAMFSPGLARLLYKIQRFAKGIKGDRPTPLASPLQN